MTAIETAHIARLPGPGALASGSGIFGAGISASASEAPPLQALPAVVGGKQAVARD